MSHNVDNYYRAVGTYCDNKLDEYFATITSAIISKSFDIIARSYRAVETRLKSLWMKLILRIIWNNTFTMKSFKSMRALTFENTVFSIGTYTTIQTWVRFTTTFLWRKWNYKYFQDIIASSESLKQVHKLLTVFYMPRGYAGVVHETISLWWSVK